MNLRLWFYSSTIFIFFFEDVDSFLPPFSAITTQKEKANVRGNELTMKWLFTKGMGSLQDLGGVGSQGEYYYIPSKKPTLKAPDQVLGKERIMPIFPRNQVLAPLGEEYIGVYEMRYRQLFNNIGERGTFGHIYYSQENQKLALVGTLTRVRRIERLDDGGMYVLMEGIGRFYLKDVVSEKPFLKAKVQIFNDHSENEVLLESLEQRVFEQVRYSVKIMKLLYPQNNYTMSETVMRYRPPLPSPDVRAVCMRGKEDALDTRSKFSFAIMDMLKTDPITKILFLQDYITEKRYNRILKVLEESTKFLENEMRKRGVVTEQGLEELRHDLISDTNDIESSPAANWVPSNFVNGDWKQRPVSMD